MQPIPNSAVMSTMLVERRGGDGEDWSPALTCQG